MTNKRSNSAHFMLFGVVMVIVWLIAMIVGLFFWSFGTAVVFGMALALIYALAIFSFNYLRGNRQDAISGGVFGLLLCMIVLFFGNFVEKKNWSDKTIIIDETGNVRIGYAASVTVDDTTKLSADKVSEMEISEILTQKVSTIVQQEVSEILTQAVSTIKTQDVSIVEEQNISTIKTQNVSVIEEQNVSTIKTQNVSVIEEQNVSTIKTQNVSVIEEQNVSTIKTQNVSVIEEQNVSTIKTQNVSVIEEQNVSTIKTQNVSVIEEQNVSTIKNTTVPTTKTPETTTVTTAHTCSWKLTDSKAATCTQDGYEKYSCSCGKTSTKSINALGHNWSSWQTVEATCEQSGYKVRSCTRCGHEEKTTIQPKGHSWDSGVITTQATCTQTGVKTYTCRNCHQTKTETVPMTNHTPGTWQHDDSQHWKECSSCRTKIDCASHSWDAGTVTVQPTEYSEGTKTYRCSVCGHSKTESIAKLPPSKPAVIEVEATFASPNYSYSANKEGGATLSIRVVFKNVTSVPSSVVSTSVGTLEVVSQGQLGSDYVIVYNVTGITEANVGSSIFLSLASGYDFVFDPVCTITE